MEIRKKINLGSGNLIENSKEWINHDLIKHRKEIDITCDLNDTCFGTGIGIKVNDLYKEPLPRQIIGTFEEIKAWDVIEHLDDPINFMNNCWYLLKEGGTLHVKACGYQNTSYWIDITHKKGYHIDSFDYFVLGTDLEKEYSFYTSCKWKMLEKGYDRKQNVIVKLQKI